MSNRNYRGWGSNRRYSSRRTRNSDEDATTSRSRRNRNDDQDTITITSGSYLRRVTRNTDQDTMSSRSRLRRRTKQTFSESEMITRKLKSILSKLTPETLHRLLPKIIDIYRNVKDENTLETFLTVIFDCVTTTNLFQAQYIQILNELIIFTRDKKMMNELTTISSTDFLETVLTLSQKHFKKGVKKLHVNDDEMINFSYVDDYEWHKLQQKMSLLSISKFIGKLAASNIMDLAMALYYLNALFKDEKNENNIEAVCCIFTEISECISNDKRISLMNAERNVIDVSMRSHLLVYGYAHQYCNNYVPPEVVDFCIGYYDADCYLFKYFQKLQMIANDNTNYGMRIRILAQNIIHYYLNE